MGRASKRELLLDTAETLFSRLGYAATGINQITEEAGVATMTLYNNFDSKEELIVAMLERRARRFRELFESQIVSYSDDPYEQILAVFDVIHKWIRSDLRENSGFAGCAFIRAASEFKDPEHEVHIVALSQKRDIIKLFERLLKEAGYSNVKEKALELHLLFDGALTQSQVLGNKKSAKRARSMAELLLSYE